jgi:hypothetical protein
MSTAVEMSPDEFSALWRRLDVPGHEAVRIYEEEDRWYVDGTSIFLFEGKPCRLEYLIECDEEWRTRCVTVDGFVGDAVVAIEIDVDGDIWYLNAEEVTAVAGCIDIDLNFSPVTNLLPIKRLDLGVGESGDVRAAWLRFPSFSLEPLEQTYKRVGDLVYNYRSTTGFEKEITVDEHGVVAEYSDFWTRES